MLIATKVALLIVGIVVSILVCTIIYVSVGCANHPLRSVRTGSAVYESPLLAAHASDHRRRGMVWKAHRLEISQVPGN